MHCKLVSAGISSLVLSGCVVVSTDYHEDAYVPRERFSSECAEQARAIRMRRIDVEPARALRDGEWEAMVNATDQAGRDARLRCSYDARTRRVTIDRLDR